MRWVDNAHRGDGEERAWGSATVRVFRRACGLRGLCRELPQGSKMRENNREVASLFRPLLGQETTVLVSRGRPMATPCSARVLKVVLDSDGQNTQVAPDVDRHDPTATTVHRQSPPPTAAPGFLSCSSEKSGNGCPTSAEGSFWGSLPRPEKKDTQCQAEQQGYKKH